MVSPAVWVCGWNHSNESDVSSTYGRCCARSTHWRIFYWCGSLLKDRKLFFILEDRIVDEYRRWFSKLFSIDPLACYHQPCFYVTIANKNNKTDMFFRRIILFHVRPDTTPSHAFPQSLSFAPISWRLTAGKTPHYSLVPVGRSEFDPRHFFENSCTHSRMYRCYTMHFIDIRNL